MPGRRIFSLTIGCILFSFAVFAVLWLYVFNRYNILHYQEQIQLFRFDGFYFRSYLDLPGGLSGYAGSFLTQFYAYPVAGALIITSVLLAVFLFFYDICRSRGNIGELFILPFVPAVLLMMSFEDIHFDMSAAVGLLFILAAFRLYCAMPVSIRYGAGVGLLVVFYFVAGGNALLMTVMIFIFELIPKEDDRPSKHKGKLLYLLLLLIWSVLLPWLAWRMIYTVSVREAYFALTPANFLFPTIANNALWLSFPVLYLIWSLVAIKIKKWNISIWKTLVSNCLFTVLVTTYGAYSVYDRRAEILNRMAYDLQHSKWDDVMALSSIFPTSNRLVCYLTNIALAESGQMPYRMFQYKQIGVAGLFLDWQSTYFSLWYQGEIYYRLGMIPEAEQCAFEALVSSPKEPNAQTLRRLVITNMVRRDSATAEKYLGYFDHSLFYRKWSQQQRVNLTKAMADTAFQIPGAPTRYHCSDFFLSYQQPDYSLLMLLESNPTHRMAFEYLMSYYMLHKDLEMVKRCLDRFYRNFSYPNIPTHYEEALIAYKNAMRAGDDFYTQYPVSQTTRDRFDRYVAAFKAAQGSKRNLELLEKQFGNTYWFYIHFIEPTTLQKTDEKNRY